MAQTNPTDNLPQAGEAETPLAVYERQVASGELRADSGQREVVERLQSLFDYVVSDDFTEQRKGLRRLFGGHKLSESHRYGAYLWGDVGRGKSMLMDLFFEQVPIKRKKRVHFHAFMRDVHAQMYAWRQLKADHDLLQRVVNELVAGVKLLCLDEIQVHDVTDAMILSRLFSMLLDAGVVVVFTSNRPPMDLYQGGIQRDQFVQFIELVEQRVDIVKIKSDIDYRLEQLRSLQQVYFSPLGEASQDFLYETYQSLTHGHESEPMVLEVQGRKIPIDKTACGVAWMTFAELCERPLGAGDYLELSALFHTLVLQDIPELSPEKRNEAKRFVTLVDTLYEHKVKLICSAEVAAEALYPKGDGAFEFERTVSRLIEMQSAPYLAAGHLSE